jgi:hypothetical protein
VRATRSRSGRDPPAHPHRADISSWDELAARTPLSRSTLKDLGTVRGRTDETHLRVIAAACEIPYAWFTVADTGRTVAREDDEPAVAERVEALERQVAALLRGEASRHPSHGDVREQKVAAHALELPPVPRRLPR